MLEALEKLGDSGRGLQRGWQIVPTSLKSRLETGQGMDIFARPKAA